MMSLDSSTQRSEHQGPPPECELRITLNPHLVGEYVECRLWTQSKKGGTPHQEMHGCVERTRVAAACGILSTTLDSPTSVEMDY